MVASSSMGKLSVRRRGKPQKVQIRPASKTTKEIRVVKSSDANLPATNITQARAVKARPRASGVAVWPNVRLRWTHAKYNATGGNSMPWDKAGSVHQSWA